LPIRFLTSLESGPPPGSSKADPLSGALTEPEDPPLSDALTESEDFPLSNASEPKLPLSNTLTEPVDPPVKGYYKLAALMGKSRQMSIFRRFGQLTMFNLLSLQADLIALEAEFRETWLEDAWDLDRIPLSGLSLTSFEQLRHPEGTIKGFQLHKLLILREKLQ
jgi:hypothetical protein